MTNAQLEKRIEQVLEEEADFLIPLLAQETLDMTKRLIESNKHISGSGKKQKLSTKYKKRKKKDGYGAEPILKRTGDLVDSLKANLIKTGKKSTIEITSDLKVGKKGTRLFDLHQYGQGNMPVRRIINESTTKTYDWESKLNKKYRKLLIERVVARIKPLVKK